MSSISSDQSLADVECEHILRVVALCDGNRTQAAKLLKISLRGLRIKLHLYSQAGIAVPPVNLKEIKDSPTNLLLSVPALGSLKLDG
jgi:hypothetical protein